MKGKPVKVYSYLILVLHLVKIMNKNIAVVCGGFSGEHVISEMSGKVVYSHLKGHSYEPFLISITKSGWFLINESEQNVEVNKTDFSVMLNGFKLSFAGVFIAIHGTPGEDGLLQGYFDMIGIRYNSSSVFSSGITFNKKLCNDLLKQHAISSAKGLNFSINDTINNDAIIEYLGLPCFVKPNAGGSSLGISKVTEVHDLKNAISKAFKEDNEILIEEFIEGTEVTCGVINFNNEIISIGVTEIVCENEFFDYEAKYHDSLTQEITPARISDDMYKLVGELTKRIYKILQCRGMIRADYIIQNNTPYLIEVNTVPGLTESSLIPKMANYSDITLTELFENECAMMLQ